MRSLHSILFFSWLLLWIPHNTYAGILGSLKSGSTQALAIKYTPDPDATTSTGELTITVSTATGVAAASDRNLEVVLYISSQYGKATAYSVQLTLPQGALTANAKLHFLQPPGYGQWIVDVFEDGRSIVAPNSNNPSSMNSQSQQTWLEITPSIKTQTSFQVDYGLAGVTVDRTLLSTASEDWRAYLAFDAVAIPQSQLSIATSAQIQAWSTYVLAGGNLIVHSADSSAAADLDRLMGSSSQVQAPDYRWEAITSVHRNFGSKRSHGGGKLIAFEQAPNNVNEHVKSSVQFPVSEFAVNGESDFRWFWRNLVQSVGTAPVWGFIVFITLFVIVVGPVLLRLTTKMQHRTLLLFLVPTLSLLATLLILFYNVVREGFGTYGRIASVQYLDDHTGQGFVWSRQSYFSGAPPRDGLLFPAGAFLKPADGDLQSHRRYNYDPRDSVSAVIQSNGESEIISGWLRPRSQQQVLVGQREDKAKLPISIQRVTETSVRVANQTDHPIPLLFLRESNEVAYIVEDLKPGESQEIAAESASKIDSLLRLKTNYEPQEPESIDLASFRYYGFKNRAQTSDPINNVARKVVCSKLNDFGFWILLLQPPDIQLPFDKSVYASEKHFHIMTGVSKW